MNLSFSNKKITIPAILMSLVFGVILATSPLVADAAPSCNLHAGSGDILVIFSTNLLYANPSYGDVFKDYSVNIPAGTYKVTATTWDDHSSHGGQGQTQEQIWFALRNIRGATYDGIVAQTGSTRDVPEYSDTITSTVSSSLYVSTNISVLTAVHAAYPSSVPESVAPVCVLFERLDSPTTDPTNGVCGYADGTTVDSQPTGSAACSAGTYSSSPSDTSEQYLWSCVGSNGGTTDYCEADREDDPEEPEDLSVTCEVDDRTVEVDEYVTFTAVVEGGEYPYEYEWDGDIEGEDDDNRTLHVRYDDEGYYYVTVTVRDDDGNFDYASCPSVRVEEEDDDDFEITCEVDDTSVEVGDEVEFTVDIDGGNGPFEYEWDGDIEGEDDDERRLRVEYDDEGRYYVDITVTDDDGRRRNDSCSVVRVSDDDDDDHDINVSSDDVPTGQLASLDSVFLNQVPVTGFGNNTQKIAWFLSFLTIWSGLVFGIFYKRHQKMLRSKEIARFKEANRSR